MQAPYRTYVVGLPIAKGAFDLVLLWDTAEPYHYVRLVNSSGELAARDESERGGGARDGSERGGGAGFDVLIVGGEYHKTAHDDDAEARWQRLEAWARNRWPATGAAMYKWSGQGLEPAGYLAFSGRNPDGAQHVYMASGDSGQGMTHGTIAGILLTDLIMKRKNPWEEIYDPKRITLAFQPVEELVKENVDVAIGFVKDLVSRGANESEIAPGEGKVIRRGMQKIAAYRDDSGAMHYCSAVCRHLKCVVAWNSAEGTWDCPCHGSRFDSLGRVINGPALADLEEVEPTIAGGKPAWSSREKKATE